MSLRLIQASLLLAVAACGASGPGSARSGDNSSTIATANSQPFKISDIATFDDPWAMAFLPGSTTALVTEKAGKIWLVDVANGRKAPVAGAPTVAAGGQGGLLDIVLSPHFASDRFVYVTYSEPSPNGGGGLALARARYANNRLDGLQVIWRDPAGGRGGQFGAIVTFAPDGRSLFLSSGERQRFTPAQDPSQPLGKILHLTLDGKPAPDNPFAGRTGAQTVTVTEPPKDTETAKNAAGKQVTWPGPNLTPAETWTSGHRNPYGLTFAPDGRLWETEMGPRGGDELNLIERGKNYGWPDVSEGENYDRVPIAKHASNPKFEPPKLYWVPSISPTSLLIYTGNLFPQWKGSGLIGTLTGPGLIRVTFNGDSAQKADEYELGMRIRFVGQGPDGAVYLLQDGPGAKLMRLTPS